jgi:hypothetical protein
LKSSIPSMVWKTKKIAAQSIQHCVKAFKIVAQSIKKKTQSTQNFCTKHFESTKYWNHS